VKLKGTESRAVIAGIGFSFVFHLALSILLYSAASAGSADDVPVVSEVADQSHRRAPFGELSTTTRRFIEGPVPRSKRFAESSRSRRPILELTGRRIVQEPAARPYRFIELARGRRTTHVGLGRKDRGIDFGPADKDILHAMLVPKLGLKKADARKLPRLTKYEQPERVEDGINIKRENLAGKPVKHKDFVKKKAEFDKRRKKNPSLSDLIDSPEDDDPRKRATMLSDIVGVEDGAVWGEGTDGKVGDLYLAKVEKSIRSAFNVPVFLSREELKKLVVEIEIRQMDGKGRIVTYKMRRKSRSGAFNSAAIEAIKRFVREEGGSKTLPVPKTDMLQYVNRRGILVRLEGRKLK